MAVACVVRPAATPESAKGTSWNFPRGVADSARAVLPSFPDLLAGRLALQVSVRASCSVLRIGLRVRLRLGPLVHLVVVCFLYSVCMSFGAEYRLALWLFRTRLSYPTPELINVSPPHSSIFYLHLVGPGAGYCNYFCSDPGRVARIVMGID